MKNIINIYKRTGILFAYLAICITAFSLTGWVFLNSEIKDLIPGKLLSNPVSSLLFLIGSLSFLLVIRPGKRYRETGTLLAAVIVSAGLLKFIETLTGFDSGIDQWLFTEKLPLNGHDGRPNMIAPNTAVTFIFFGASLLFYNFRIGRRNILADYFASVSGLVAIVSVIGYLYNAMEFYHGNMHVPMAFPTAACFLLLSFAILLYRSEFGFFSLFTRKYEGSRAARIMVPFAVLIPLISGYLRLYGEEKGIFSAGLGTALFTIINIVLFLFLIWRTVIRLNLSGKTFQAENDERRRTQLELIKSQLELKDLYDNTPAGYYSLDENGFFVSANNTTLEWFGYSHNDLLGKHITEMLTDEGKEIYRRGFPVFKKTGKISGLELNFIRKDGSKFPVIINSSVVRDVEGKFLYTRSTMMNISERKRLEDELRRNNVFLDTVLENIPNMVFVKDADELRFLRFNKAGEKLLGLRKKDLIGKNDYDLFPKEKGDYFTETDRRVIADGKMLDIEEELIQTQDGERWLHTKKIPISDDNNQPQYLLGISEDITEKKEAGDALKDSNEKFLKLFYSSPVAMVIRDISTGVIIDINEEYERLSGIPKDQLVGKATVGAGIVLDPEHSDEMIKGLSQKIPIKNIEATFYNSENNPLNVMASIEYIRLGKTDCIILALLDITERKSSEQQLKELNRELESFTYSVSHDLRAPLRIINGYAELIGSSTGSGLNQDTRRMLANIIDNSKRMGQLIDDLLNFSRLGKREVVRYKTDMNEIVRSVINEQFSDMKNNIELDPVPPCDCDGNLIKQVWQNLVSNAVKYSSKEAKPMISIGSQRINGTIVYHIKDNGVGFDMKYYDKLFGVFQRLHNSSEYEGTGVGLALVQRILKKHGGTIWAESAIGNGTTFYFSVCK